MYFGTVYVHSHFWFSNFIHYLRIFWEHSVGYVLYMFNIISFHNIYSKDNNYYTAIPYNLFFLNRLRIWINIRNIYIRMYIYVCLYFAAFIFLDFEFQRKKFWFVRYVQTPLISFIFIIHTLFFGFLTLKNYF